MAEECQDLGFRMSAKTGGVLSMTTYHPANDLSLLMAFRPSHPGDRDDFIRDYIADADIRIWYDPAEDSWNHEIRYGKDIVQSDSFKYIDQAQAGAQQSLMDCAEYEYQYRLDRC
jgi:hypothetical protein